MCCQRPKVPTKHAPRHCEARYPQAFALVGGLIILLSIAAVLTSSRDRIAGSLRELVVGLLFLLTSQVLGRRDFRAHRYVDLGGRMRGAGVLIFEAVRIQKPDAAGLHLDHHDGICTGDPCVASDHCGGNHHVRQHGDRSDGRARGSEDTV